MAERQAFGIDINEYSRTGGINYERVQECLQTGIYDFLIVKAGLGLRRCELLDEQMENIDRIGVPRVTYHFLDVRVGLKAQAQAYFDWVGSAETAYIVDVEKPKDGGRLPTRDELLRYIDELSSLTGQQPVIYSRMNVLEAVRFVDEARHFRLWMAQYPYDRVDPDKKLQYRRFNDFTRDFAGNLPGKVKKAGLEANVLLWQFSEKGDGPHYIYNERTNHPKFKKGMKSADLNISIASRTEFMQALFGESGVIETVETPVVVSELPAGVPPYPSLTNQNMINLIFKAARPFTQFPWDDWIVRARLEFMAIPKANRDLPYTGPRIENLPNLTAAEKEAILQVMGVVLVP